MERIRRSAGEELSLVAQHRVVAAELLIHLDDAGIVVGRRVGDARRGDGPAGLHRVLADVLQEEQRGLLVLRGDRQAEGAAVVVADVALAGLDRPRARRARSAAARRRPCRRPWTAPGRRRSRRRSRRRRGPGRRGRRRRSSRPRSRCGRPTPAGRCRAGAASTSAPPWPRRCSSCRRSRPTRRSSSSASMPQL